MTENAWGEVPRPVRQLIDSLRGIIRDHSERLSQIDWPEGAGDITPQLLTTLEETERVMQASKDLRSLLTAYAHKMHQPRPKMADVARAQSASPQAVTTRYTTKTTAALEQLLEHPELVEGKPTPIGEQAAKILQDGFPSLNDGPIDLTQGRGLDVDLSFELTRAASSAGTAKKL